MDLNGDAFCVMAATRERAEEQCRRMCKALGLVPLGRPMESLGTGRWMARARPAEPDGETAGR